ncbi:defects in morphology protein 1 [Phlyctema vagabunda]|uniref:Defects in morphology protein 1 n=1 Tax=Phlyctema vagabunda TaxID=108571 RepID=A0ABR4PVV6_9HELO
MCRNPSNTMRYQSYVSLASWGGSSSLRHIKQPLMLREVRQFSMCQSRLATQRTRLVSSPFQMSEMGSVSAEVTVPVPDNRSPLERFRTKPKKAFSVSDLISPAWCELQFWYILTKYGKKKRTPEMKQGSVVHQKLEDEVHTRVRVEIQTREDALGLKIWNVIQGLRTLRETGQTRELEVWGTLDGFVVNGVIDVVKYIHLKPIKARKEAADQPKIQDFFPNPDGTSTVKITSSRKTKDKKIAICDVKTRGVKSLPSDVASRPTRMQLMIYHRLLSALACNEVDFSVIVARYDLKSDVPFSDSFLAQVGSLNDEIDHDVLAQSDGEYEPTSSQDSMTTLLAHNSLSALWSLMIAEFKFTMPEGAGSFASTLQAEYRTRDTGDIIGTQTFAMDDKILSTYLKHEMRWWKGERPAEGVVLEEVYKCRFCDFAEDCEWRATKAKAVVEKAKSRRSIKF